MGRWAIMGDDEDPT